MMSLWRKKRGSSKNLLGSRLNDGTLEDDASARYNVKVSAASNERSGGMERGPKDNIAIGWRNLARWEDSYLSRPAKDARGFS
jgi:hypothetical protein